MVPFLQVAKIVSVHVYVYACMHVCVRACVCVYVYVCMHECVWEVHICEG